MSLKTFHLFFISICSALCFFLMIWGMWDYKGTGTVFSLVLGGIGALGLLALVQYFKWFRKKWRVLPVGLVSLGLSIGLLASSRAEACAVCTTDPNSPLTKGAIIGVAFLGVVIVTVLALIVSVARSWMKRARHLHTSF